MPLPPDHMTSGFPDSHLFKLASSIGGGYDGQAPHAFRLTGPKSEAELAERMDVWRGILVRLVPMLTDATIAEAARSRVAFYLMRWLLHYRTQRFLLPAAVASSQSMPDALALHMGTLYTRADAALASTSDVGLETIDRSIRFSVAIDTALGTGRFGLPRMPYPLGPAYGPTGNLPVTVRDVADRAALALALVESDGTSSGAPESYDWPSPNIPLKPAGMGPAGFISGQWVPRPQPRFGPGDCVLVTPEEPDATPPYTAIIAHFTVDTFAPRYSLSECRRLSDGKPFTPRVPLVPEHLLTAFERRLPFHRPRKLEL